MPGLLSRLPDLGAVLAFSGNAVTGTTSFLGSLDGAQNQQAGSPLESLANVLTGIRGHTNIDVSGLNQLPHTFQTIQNAVPPGMIDSLQGAVAAFGEARDFLRDSPLSRAIAEGKTLEQTGLAFIETGVQALRDRQAQLGLRLIDSEALRKTFETFQTLDRFRTGFAANQADFLPFLSKQLIGVAPDLLQSSLSHVDGALAVYNRVGQASLDASLGVPRQGLNQAFKGVADALETFDPADTQASQQLEALLGTLGAAMTTLSGAAGTLYTQVQQAVDNHTWDNILPELETGLRAITISQPFSIDDLVNALRSALSELILRLQTMFGPEDVVARIQALTQTVTDTFQSSPLGEVRKALQDFLERIRHAIEAIPLEGAQHTVEDMLGRVRREIQSAGLDQIGQTIERALTDAETFVTSNVNQTLRDNVRTALQQLQQTLRRLPFQDLSEALTTALTTLRDLITELEGALAGTLDSVSNFLSQLESLSFTPVSDAVIQEIDAVKQQLAAINPNALSDIEKTALRTALSVLTSLDLESAVIGGLKTAFGEAGQGLRRLLDELGAVLDRLKQQLDQYQPEQMLASLTNVLNRAMEFTERLNGQLLMRPLYEQLDAAVREFQMVSPGSILTPLQQPFGEVLGVVDHLDPANWLGPLNELHAAIDRLLSFVDVTPLLTELDNRRRALFSEAKTAILDAIDRLNAPEPIAGFLATLRPFVDAITDALFLNLDAELPRLGVRLRTQLRFSALFAPLDAAFDQLMQMVLTVPAQPLTDAMNSLRQTLALGLEKLNPRSITDAFRAGLQTTEGLAPQILFSPALSLPMLFNEFNQKLSALPSPPAGALAVRARFEQLLLFAEATNPNSSLNLLTARHAALVNSLRRRVNSLNVSRVEEAYAGLNQSMEKLLPDFLRQRDPLTRDQIIAGLEAMRPSRHAGPLDDLVNDFLKKLEPLNAAIEGPANAFFRGLASVINLLNPLSLRDAVASIYQAVRQKLQAINPVVLAQSFRANVFEPIRNMLGQLDPAHWRERLDQVFQRVIAAIAGNLRVILNDITGIIDEELRAIRQLLSQFVDNVTAAIQSALETMRDVINRIENLVFVELLERLRRILDNLEASFNRELDRVRNSFDAMLAAIPLGGARSASASAEVTA